MTLPCPFPQLFPAWREGFAFAAVSYGAYWGYREFGFIAPAIVVFVLVETVAIVVYQYRKLKRSDREVWDWWAGQIKE